MISKINPAVSAANQDEPKTRVTAAPSRVATLRRLRWALPPLLAIVAYATVLRVGFLSDDYLMLFRARSAKWDLELLQPDPTWFFYRPISYLLTWIIGWHLWGLNSVPYHALGLLLHAGTALFLGLAVAQMSRNSIGLLTGSIFAVFPLHLEAVAWTASQWDLWAAFFGVLSLYLFTRWWKQNQTRLYVAALALYAAGVYSKESLLTFLPVFALVAWLISKRFDRQTLKRLALALLPFALVLLSNLLVRFLTWGNIGGYQGAQLKLDEVWDRLIAFMHILLAPINPAILGQPVAQIVGILVSGGWLLGLVFYGREQWRLLLVALGWLSLCAAPVLSLPVGASDLSNNRFFYLASAGYCLGIAALLYQAIVTARRWRRVVGVSVIAVLLLSTVTTWLQLQPWRTATLQVQDIAQELAVVFPPQPARYNHTWYTENTPDTYKGVFLLRLGIGALRGLTSGDTFYQVNVPSAKDAPLSRTDGDAFAVRFKFDEQSARFHVDYAAAITTPPDPPGPNERGASFTLWDFTKCDATALKQWQPANVTAQCVPGQGLTLHPQNDDPQMSIGALKISPQQPGDQFIRLRVSMSAAQTSAGAPAVSELFWIDQKGAGFNPDQHAVSMLRQDQQAHTYWTFLQPTQFNGALTALRFDPINEKVDTTIRWIAIDTAP